MRLAIAGLLAAAALATSPASAAASTPASGARVLIVFAAAPSGAPDDAIEPALAGLPLSLGLLSATEGAYRTSQFLLDITQGARIATSSYTRHLPPALAVLPAGAGAYVPAWPQVLRRAYDAPATLRPGLLAATVPGGAAYAGFDALGLQYALAAARRDGRIEPASTGPAATLPARVDALLSTHRLVVADLPAGAAGFAQLRSLLARRPASELILVLQRVPNTPGHELQWIAAAGLGGPGELTSSTTNERGLVSAVDIAPTVLAHLGVLVPDTMNGRPIRVEGTRNGAALRSRAQRLRSVYHRRLPTLIWLVAGCAALVALLWRWPRPRHAALRIAGLALLWAPVGALLTAALSPGATAEKVILTVTCLILGALTDRLMPWPRGPVVPAVVAVLALAADALAGTQLEARSLLGPNPAYGARFYGIGNELKSGLAVLVLAAVAAALTPGERSRRAALSMAGAGVVLAVLEGSARLGAGVGGVILVAAGAAVATIMVLPGRINRRRVLVVLAAPALALIALAAIDLATAHGTGHFTGSILHAHSAGDVRDILVRRYGNAWGATRNGLMPVAAIAAVIAAVLGIRFHRRLLAPLPDPVWEAALAGGLTAGVVGTLVEDSGTVLLVVAVFALSCVVVYVWGTPRAPPRALTPQRPGRALIQE